MNTLDIFKKANEDEKKIKELLDEKIDEKLKAIHDKRKEEIKYLNKKIKELLEEDELKKKKLKEKESNISKEGITIQNFLPEFLNSISKKLEKEGMDKATQVLSPIVAAGIGTLAGISIGIGIGVGLGLVIGLTNLIISWRKEKKYKDNLKEYRNKIEKYFKEFSENRENDFKTYHEQFRKELNNRKVLYKKDIVEIDENVWKLMKRENETIKLKFNEEFNFFSNE
jgi:hypothetical protein